MIYMAPGAVVTGQVTLGENVNIWYGAVLRGDSGEITVEEGTNIQEHCILHEKTQVGAYCTVGHRAILHGCTVGDKTLIGMGAIVLNGAKIGPHCIVGAGSLVTGKMDAPEGSLILGSPAKVVRPLTEEEMAALREDALQYITLAEKSLPVKK
jgi:carbonic anhydrase/acetyltransferase-like protein (isoleucine patch superfamily)